MNSKPIEVAIAILYSSDRFLMQLRDDIPGIFYPGHWGFFGGHLDPGETPEEAMKRELIEEINYSPSSLGEFKCYRFPEVIRHVFHAPLTVGLDQLVLKEGWDLGLLTPEQIRSGSCYSQKAGKVCPLGSPHQKILLDFLEERSVQ